jgi:hypothetical protein
MFHLPLMNGSQSPLSSPQTASGLVITLASDPYAAAKAIEALQNKPGIELGERRGRWLAAAFSGQKPRDEHAWIESLPGVELVEVVFVGFEPEDAAGVQSGSFPAAVPNS